MQKHDLGTQVLDYGLVLDDKGREESSTDNRSTSFHRKTLIDLPTDTNNT